MKSLYQLTFLCFVLCCSSSISRLQAMSLNTSHSQTELLNPPPQDDCNTSPVISCPANYYSCPGDITAPSNTGYATAVAGESDCPAPIVSYSDEIESEGPCEGEIVIKRTWSAVYPNTTDPWLFANCTQVIRLFDDQAPDLSNCPDDISLTSYGSCSEVVNWTPPTATDNCIVTLSSTHNPGDVFSEGTTTVVYTATDDCGNQSTCSFTITIECACNDNPIINCPESMETCPGNSYPPSLIGAATASPGGPNCAQPTLTYTDEIISTNSCGEKEINRIWTATDPDNPSLTSSCIQAISLIDDTAPVMSNCPSDITLETNTNVAQSATWTSPTASDNCSTVSLTSTADSGDTFGEGTTVVTYTATDECGNSVSCSFNVTVIFLCNENPIITCPADYYTCPGSPYPPSIAGTATADSGGVNCVTPTITYTDDVWSSNACGEQMIERIWKATDPNNSDLVDSCVQIITLEDNTAPSLSDCPSDITLETNTNVAQSATWTSPTASDNCSTVSLTSTADSGDTFGEGTTVVTYTATDECGNSVSCSFNVTVIFLCNENPIITCPADYYTCPGSPYPPSIAGTATADSGGVNCATPTITYTDDVWSSNACGEQMIERIWKATDPNNSDLVDSCVQIITLEDNTAPSLSDCPADITVQASGDCSQIVTWAIPTATDDCNSVEVSSNYAPGSSFEEGTTTIVYVATDACGNTTSCTFHITIECSCNESPIISCPTDFEGCVGTNMVPSITGAATAVAGGPNCDTPIITYSDDVWSNGPCGSKTIERTWKATDPENEDLFSTCLQIITLSDTEAPVLNDCPANITVSGSVPVNWTEPTATDNCTDFNISSDYTNGQVFPLGTTTVTITAMDNCANASTCTFTVTVEPNIELECPDDIIVDCNVSGGAVVHFDLPTVDSECEVCPYEGGSPINGFMYMGAFNGHHYYCSMSPDTWENAQATSASFGGQLAVINSQEENTFLANILTLQSAYIGLSDKDLEGEFEWVNGDPITYTNWYPNQPNDYGQGQDYVEMLNNGQWNDQYASSSLEYIMEISCGGGITQTGGLASGSVFPIGTTTVSFTATDECGNADTCSFDITVESSISIECYDDATFSCPNSTSGVIVNWGTPNVHSCCNTDCNEGGAISGYVYMGNYNGSHYYCSAETATWNDAQALAVSIGGNLATINDAAENSFLASKIPSNGRAWIGLNDAALEGEMQWASGEPFTYANWYPGQPNDYNYQQDYVELLGNGQWNDQYNHFSLEYIVEIPSCNSITQITGPSSGSLFQSGTTTTITYSAADDCGNVDTCSFDITIESPSCTSGGNNSNSTWIEKVRFNSISNVSGNNGGYADFTSQCTNVIAGNVYPIFLQPGYASTATAVYWKIWIDYNMDGDYDDASEYVGYGGGVNPLKGYLTIPSNVWNGNTTMRVVMKKGSYPTGPCESYEYGETEDYCISIGGAEKPARTIGTERRVLSMQTAVNLDDQKMTEVVTRSTEFENLEITVSPNPSITKSEIRLGNNNTSTTADDMMILSIDGSQVDASIITESRNGSYSINTSNLASGIYIIIAKKDGKTYQTKMMVTK